MEGGEQFADLCCPTGFVCQFTGQQRGGKRSSVSPVPRKSLTGAPTSIGEGKCSPVAILTGGNVRQLVGAGRGRAVFTISTLESCNAAGEMFARAF